MSNLREALDLLDKLERLAVETAANAREAKWRLIFPASHEHGIANAAELADVRSGHATPTHGEREEAIQREESGR
jgi:hypothetical protein